MITTDAEPTLRRWTQGEYFAMAEIGLFEGQHVELIEGEILVMSPQNDPHCNSILKIMRVVGNAFGPGFTLRPQLPLRLDAGSAPEPDVAVVRGTEDDYDDQPSVPVLVIEVSGSTLKLDQTRKAPLYAKSGIEDYWIVNLWGRCVEVYRSPKKDASGKYLYESVLSIGIDGTIAPLTKPESRIAVADLFPPERFLQK